MKCRYCDGTGTSNICVNGTFKSCAACDGTGEEVPEDEVLYITDTNFDRITQSPEALAEFISEITCECWGCKAVYAQDCPHSKNRITCFCDKESTLEWLKRQWLKQESTK